MNKKQKLQVALIIIAVILIVINWEKSATVISTLEQVRN